MSFKTFNQLIDFTRTSAATFVGSNGLIQITPASRNLLTFTQEFDNSAWTKTNATVTANTSVAPDGTSTADTLLATAVSGSHSVSAATAGGSGAALTFSVFAKAGTSNFLQLWHGAAASIYANFNLSTGAVGTVGASATAAITSIGNGWYRCSITFTPGSSNACRVAMITSATAAYAESWTATGTESILIWGAQLEAVPDANLVLGSELRGGGVVSTAGSPSPLATYNTTTGEATLNRVDGSNVSGVRIPVGGAGRAIRVSVTITATTGIVQVRGNGIAGTILGTVGTAAGTYVLYVVSDTADIYLTMSSNATTASITVNSVKQITGTTGMPTDYTRNFGGVYPPRFDYDPVTLAPRGLLIEEQRTNLLLRSEEFENASWGKVRSSITADATTSPDGTMDADKLVEDTTATQSHAISQSPTIATATTYTGSVYLKAGERTFARLLVGDSSGANAVRVDVNLTTGAVSSGTNGTGWTLVAASATDAGNGWWRVVVTGTSATSTSGSFIIYLATALGTITYTGDGTSGIYVWGAQLEASSFPTSYIPTAASQVTRTADVATITGANFSQWYNQSEGTFVIEGDTTSLVSGRFPGTLQVTDGTSSNRLGGYFNQASGVYVTRRDLAGSPSSVPGTANSATQNVVFKAATAYSAAGMASVLNGGTVATNATGNFPAVNRLDLGIFDERLNGHIRSIRYYPTRLTNTQLQALTA